MRKARVLLLTLALLPACTPSPTATDPDRFGDVELVADQSTLPPESNGLSVLTDNDEDTAEIWSFFGFEGEPPSIEDGNRVALFLGSGESGSCPIELVDVQASGGDVRLEAAEHDENCTADFRPRSFVFLFPASDAPEVGGRVGTGPTKIQSAQSIVPPGTDLTVIDGPCVGMSKAPVGNETKKVRLEIRPCPSKTTSAPKLFLINIGGGRLGYGPGFKLERKTDDGWRWVNRRQAFELPLIYLPPGATSKPEPIEVYLGRPQPVELKPGTYRVTKTLQLTPGKARPPTMAVRATFRLSWP